MQADTIRDLFNALGGVKAVADMVGVRPTAVYMAMHRGSIPHRWRMTIFGEAKARSIQFNPALLGVAA